MPYCFYYCVLCSIFSAILIHYKNISLLAAIAFRLISKIILVNYLFSKIVHSIFVQTKKHKQWKKTELFYYYYRPFYL